MVITDGADFNRWCCTFRFVIKFLFCWYSITPHLKRKWSPNSGNDCVESLCGILKHNTNSSFKKDALKSGMKKKKEISLFPGLFFLFANVKYISDSLSFVTSYSMGPFQLCKIWIHFEVLLKCSNRTIFSRRQSKKILNKYSIYSWIGGKFLHEKWDWYPTDVLCFTVWN